VPFDEVHSLGGIASAHEMLTGRMAESKLMEYQRNFPQSWNWARTLARSIAASAVSSLSAFIDAGIIDVRKRADWGQPPMGEPDRTDALKDIALQLMGVSPTDGQSVKLHEVESPNGPAGAKMSFRTLLLERVFAVRPEFRIAEPTRKNLLGNGNVFSDPLLEEIVKACNGNLVELVGGLKRADAEAQRLVIGTAMSSADPGQDIDVHLGSNLI
jgi:hypothetical protein